MSLDMDFSQRRVFEVFVTPEMAKSILSERNGANRAISQNVVERYAIDMADGRWMDNEQNKWIAFYSDGNLADGQHRLAAIVKSGIGRMAKFETGLGKDQSFAIDAHRMRNAAAQIKISGVSDWIKKDEIAIAKLCYFVNNGKGRQPSPSTIVDFCEDNKESLQFVSKNITATMRFITTATVRTAIFCAHKKEDEQRLAEFCKVILNGLPKSEDDYAAIRLRERLIHDGSALQGNASGRATVVRMTMRAIKAFCERQAIKKIFVPDDFIYEVPEVKR